MVLEDTVCWKTCCYAPCQLGIRKTTRASISEKLQERQWDLWA